MNPIGIFLVFFLSFHESNAFLKKEDVLFKGIFLEKSIRSPGLKNPEDLIYKCELEQESHFSNGTCLLLGIFALKAKHISLFEQIENLCIQKVRQGQLLRNSETLAFLSYYPKCKYVLEGQIGGDFSDNLNISGELKTLVRFLNN